MAKVVVTFDTHKIQAMLTGPRGPVAQDLMRRGQRVLNQARTEAPVRQGTLRASLNSRLGMIGGEPAVTVGTNLYYARYVHEGTGIYVGRGYIVPKRARFLIWKDWHTGDTVVARRVRGTPPNPFLVRALRAAR